MSAEEQVIAWLAQQETATYLVGGCVRDRLLGRAVCDLDLAVASDGLALARHLANHFRGAYYALDEARKTGRALVPQPGGRRLVVDVAQFRGPDLAADLRDRDFTINALAVDVRSPEDVIDHHHGLADLGAGLIRPVSDDAIRHDPVRALRAVRLAAELDFALVAETRALIRRDGGGLADVSPERSRDELARLLALSRSGGYLELLDELGLLTILIPELEPLRELAQPPPQHLDVLPHSLEAVRRLESLLGGHETDALALFAVQLCSHLGQVLGDARPRLVVLKLATLLHDTGKPAAREVDAEGRIRFAGHDREGAKIAGDVLRRLRFNRAEVRLGETIVRHHMRPLLLANEEVVSSRAVYRFFRDTGKDGVDVLLHALADDRATCAPGTGETHWLHLVALTVRMLAAYWDRQAGRGTTPPLVGGRDLLREFGLQPGRQIGELLEAVREAQACGEVQTREEALALVRHRLTGESKGQPA
jgi:tRNA nucleotidyltransferase/poly(A) polymerase